MPTEVRQIQVRRDTAALWTSANPTLAEGEIGYETDTGLFKIGDGATAWNSITTYFKKMTAANMPTGIDAAKIADGSISNTEFQYLNNVSSNIQTQLDGKVNDTGNESIDGVKTFTSSPIVPTPTTDFQAATKKYVDDNAGGGLSGLGANDNRVPRTVGTTGDTLESTGVVIDDSDFIIAPKLVGRSGENVTIQAGGAANEVRFADGDGLTPLVIAQKRAVLYGLTYVIQSPAQITANQNNYSVAINLGSVLRMDSDASRDITGIVINSIGNMDGLILQIINIGSNNIVLKHQDTNSTAANRLLNSTAADITLSANQSADLIYDGTTARWRVFKKN